MPKPNVIQHRSIKALLSEALCGESAEDVIRRKCRTFVAKAKAAGWSGPPFNPWHLASFLGLHVEETTEDFPGDGRIFPRRGKVIVQYRSGQMLERQRFTICHEIAHTCFPDAYEVVRHFEAKTPEEKGFLEFENLCNIGASELLFPLEYFQPDLNADAPRLSHCSLLATRYVASIDATIRRFLSLTPHSCAAAFLTDEKVDEYLPLKGRMRIQYYLKSESFHGHFPKGALLPQETNAKIEPPEPPKDLRMAKETWWINSKPRSLYIEALALPKIPNKAYAKVMALVHSRLP